MPLVGYTPVGGQATYDPDTNTHSCRGIRRYSREPWCEDHVEELQSAHGDILASKRHDRCTRGIRRQRSGAAELLGPGVPDPAGSADHPGQQLCADGFQSGDWHAGSRRCRRFRRQRYPRCHAAARRSPRYRSRRQDRGNAALVQHRVSARPARRIHGGSCVCRQPGPRHPRGLQHERGSRRLAPTVRAGRCSRSMEEQRTHRTRSRSDPITTRCR